MAPTGETSATTTPRAAKALSPARANPERVFAQVPCRGAQARPLRAGVLLAGPRQSEAHERQRNGAPATPHAYQAHRRRARPASWRKQPPMPQSRSPSLPAWCCHNRRWLLRARLPTPNQSCVHVWEPLLVRARGIPRGVAGSLEPPPTPHSRDVAQHSPQPGRGALQQPRTVSRQGTVAADEPKRSLNSPSPASHHQKRPLWRQLTQRRWRHQLRSLVSPPALLPATATSAALRHARSATVAAAVVFVATKLGPLSQIAAASPKGLSLQQPGCRPHQPQGLVASALPQPEKVQRATSSQAGDVLPASLPGTPWNSRNLTACRLHSSSETLWAEGAPSLGRCMHVRQ